MIKALLFLYLLFVSPICFSEEFANFPSKPVDENWLLADIGETKYDTYFNTQDSYFFHKGSLVVTKDKEGFGVWISHRKTVDAVCPERINPYFCKSEQERLKETYFILYKPHDLGFFYHFDCKYNRMMMRWGWNGDKPPGRVWESTSSQKWAANIAMQLCPDVLRALDEKTKALEIENEVLKREMLKMLQEKDAKKPKPKIM